MGCYDDLEHADSFVLWGANMAEMHPVLWSRLTDRRLTNPHVKVAVLSTFEHRQLRARRRPDRLQAADGPGDPQLHLQLHHPEQRRQHRMGRQARRLQEGRDQHRLRARPNHPAREGRHEQRLPGRGRQAQGRPEQDGRHLLRRLQGVCLRVHRREGLALSGVPKEQLEELAQMYADPKRKVVSYWTMASTSTRVARGSTT